MVAQEERRRATDERKKLSDEAKNAAKNALEKAGVADLDTGAAIAGGNEETPWFSPHRTWAEKT